jgi:UPF0716 protein FxsA
MRLALRILVFLLLLPAAEFLVFLVVAWAVGLLPALGLMILTSLAGGLVLRRVNRGQFAQFRRVLRDRGMAATQEGGLLVALAGILLILPGFITDLLGAALLVPPLRRRFGAALREAVLGEAVRRKPQGSGPAVIDLAPSEWKAISDRKARQPRRR